MSKLVGAIRETSRDPRFVLRYMFMGVGNISLNFGVFFILYQFFGVWYLLASTIGFLVRFVFKFVSLRYWVSGEVSSVPLLRQLSQFSLLEAVFYLLGLPILTGLVELAHVPPPIAVILTISVLYIAGLVSMRRLFKNKV